MIAADVYADAERLRRLADDLLLLARLDAGAPASDDLVDVTALAGAQGEPLLVRGNEQSLGRVFDNLISNARTSTRRRTGDAGRVGPWALVVVTTTARGCPWRTGNGSSNASSGWTPPAVATRAVRVSGSRSPVRLPAPTTAT